VSFPELPIERQQRIVEASLEPHFIVRPRHSTVLGVTEATASRRLTRKRYPSAEALIAIDKLYGISFRDLDADAVELAQRLADPDRMNYVTIARESGEMAVTKRRVAEIERRKAERVVPIEKGRKKK